MYFSVILLAGIVGLLIFLLSRREAGRRSQYGPAALNEFRTALPLDECFDRLEQHSPRRMCLPTSAAGRTTAGLCCTFTLHQPTRQPLDTLYTLRLDPGRRPWPPYFLSGKHLAIRSRCFPRRCWMSSCCKTGGTPDTLTPLVLFARPKSAPLGSGRQKVRKSAFYFAGFCYNNMLWPCCAGICRLAG